MGFYAPEDKVFVHPKVFNALVKEVLSYRLDGVQNGSFTRGAATTIICGAKGQSAGLHPYQGIDASEGSTPKVKTQMGSHNDVVPDGLDVDIDESDALTLGEDDKIVYVQLDLDESFSITSASLHSSEDMFPPESTESTAYQTLYFVAVTIDGGVASVAIADNVLGSQAYQYCGGSHLFGLV